MTQDRSSSLNHLRAGLSGCLQRDAARIRQRLARKPQPEAEELVRLNALMATSRQRVADRMARVPPLEFPDNLPICAHVQDLRELLEQHQVIIVAGETGSGKTTQLPKICLAAGRGTRGQIGHTQPRRIAARSVAMRLAEELGSPIGDRVGYQVRFTEEGSADALIKVMTDGILLAEIQNDPRLDRYDTLIIDEAHERSLNIDFLLGFILQLLPKRPDLRVIVTSATIALERFSQFFGGAPIVEVSGRTYPVDVRYRLLAGDEESRDTQVPDAVLAVLDEIAAHEREVREAPGDVLIFLPGEREIRELSKVLRHAELRHTEVLPLYARLTAAEQQRIFQAHPGRRIVLSTNVAETSLTVPGIRYVIDTGLARISRYSFRSKLQRLPIEPISQASADQRKGRCGRVAPGICFRLFSEADFQGRPAFTDAEILRTNLASVILRMVDLRLGDVAKFPFLDAPDTRLVNDGYKLLEELGAVTAQRQLTPVGRIMARLPVDPRLARMLVAASELGCLAEMLVLTSGLSIQDPRERPADRQQAADQAHARYVDKASDFMAMLNLWNGYEEQRQTLSQNQLRKYCEKHFLSWMRLREWREIHRQLALLMKEQTLRMNQQPADYAALHRALLTGLLANIARKHEGREYLGTRNRKLMIFPGSPLAKKGPDWLVAADIVETSRVFARTVARIEPEWIEPLATHLVKRHYSEPHWERRRAQVMGYEQVTLYGLDIVSRRRIAYAQVDPLISRELFIRRALVEGDFESKAPFLVHNQALLANVEEVEQRTRRRDLRVDEETLFNFYDQRIPADVVSGRHFEQWWRRLDTHARDALNMTEADVFQKQATDAAQAFPEHLHWQGVDYPLSYCFEPGQVDDGVTLTVPLMALRQLPAHRLGWLVPGLLREKCIQLVKGLPKSLRRNFVPVPDFVDAALANLEPCNEPLTRKLAQQLARMTGVQIDDSAWQESSVEPHLQMNLRVLDASGHAVAQGRDVFALQAQLSDQAEQALRDAVRATPVAAPTVAVTPNASSTGWHFGALPESAVADEGGLRVTVFPALEEHKGEVRQSRALDALTAEGMSRRAIARLLLNGMGNALDDIGDLLPDFNKAALLYAPTGQRRQLLDDLLLAGAQQHFLATAIPRDEPAFAACLNAGRATFRETLEVYSRLLHDILVRHHDIMKSIKGSVQLALAASLADVKFQLNQLVFPGFLTITPFAWLHEFPRYLEAVQVRLEKMPREMGREREFLGQWRGLWDRYAQRRDLLARQGIADAALADYRWMLEEYRVSFFAQKLGTVMPISVQRLDRQWAQVRI